MKDTIYTYILQVSFICFIILSHATEIYLHFRQVFCLKNSSEKVPEDFANQISLDEHKKSIRYSLTKLHYSIAQLFWHFLLFVFWFPYKGLNALYTSLPFSGVHKEVFFLVEFFFINFLIALPWSYYFNFYLEEKFGFNKMTRKLFFVDKVKSIIISLILATPLLYGVLYLAEASGTLWWLYSFLVFMFFQFFILWIFPTFISPLFNKFSPLEDKVLKDKIIKLMKNNNFELKDIFIMDASKRSSHGNAYFTGLGKNKRVVFFDTLLNDLSHDEIISILAHELGHMRLKHIQKSLIISSLFSLLGFALMGHLADQSWFFRGHFLNEKSYGILLLLFLQVTPIYTFLLTPLSSWFSRKNEFEADSFAAKNASAKDLISGLLTLYKKNSSPIITDRVYSLFYYSHPPAKERIDHLKSMTR